MYHREFGRPPGVGPYQALIDHPRIVPYLLDLLGPKFRLDHDYCVFMTKGGRDQDLHGGATSKNPDHWYAYRDGMVRCGLTVVTFVLSEARAGDGGFCCIPGSHKSNFIASLPPDVSRYERTPHYVVQPAVEPGDAIIFAEALIHGTLPYGSHAIQEQLAHLQDWLHPLSDPDDPALDDFARSGIAGGEDVRRIFAERLYFGCEADDSVNAWAFDTRVNPYGLALNAIFGSDIGHWDVPDIGDVVAESHELVEHGLISAANYRAFVFGNIVDLWGGANAEFFAGTAIADAARRHLERSA